MIGEGSEPPRQVLSEALVLAFSAGAVGLLIATWAFGAFRVYAADYSANCAALVVGQGVVPAVAGVTIGLAGSYLLSKLI